MSDEIAPWDTQPAIAAASPTPANAATDNPPAAQVAPWDSDPATARSAPDTNTARIGHQSAQTARGAVQAGLSGLNAGIANVAGLPIDTARRAIELSKAAMGSAYGQATKKDMLPSGENLTPDASATRTTHGLYHYVDPATGSDTYSKNPPPAGSHPFTHTQVSIPSFLQPNTQPDIGSSENIKSGMRAVFGDSSVDTQEPTPMNRVMHSSAAAVPFAVLNPEALVSAALSSAAGGAGAQAAAEAGADPMTQAAFGILAGGTPAFAASGAAAAARGIVRGGSQGRSVMQDRIADADAAGTSLTAGQASGNRALQAVESTQSKFWGGSPIKKRAEQQTEDIGGSVNRIIHNLAGEQGASPTAAGKAITAGIGDQKTPGTALGDMHAAESAAYDKLDDLIDAKTPMSASKTLATANEVGAGGGVVPVPSQISTIRTNLLEKIAANQKPTGFEGVANVPKNPPMLSYEDLRKLKTELGNSIDWGFAPSDPPANRDLIKLWSAVKDDIGEGAMAHSPEAAKAQTAANAIYQHNQEIRDGLKPFIDNEGGPEALYQAATSGTRVGATRIGRVMSALSPEQQNIIRATVLDKLGHASGAQDAPFNGNTFLTNWNKIDRHAKDALFNENDTGDLRKNLDSITSTIGNISKGTRLQNWSGTGEALGHMAGGAAAWHGMMETLAGNPAFLAKTGSAAIANNLLARLLTNPTTVRWLARSTKAPQVPSSALINQLSTLNDPDAQSLHDYLQQRPQRAFGGKVTDDMLVKRLSNRWKAAKRATDETTKPLLNVPDNAIIRALDIAQEHL